MPEPKTPLSASRIKTLQSCSWLYYSKYILGIPESGNDGSSRGSVCHLVFEVLGKPTRKKLWKKIVKKNDIFAHPPLERLVRKHANRLSVGDDANILQIKDMSMNGLKYDFFGEKRGKLAASFSEHGFDITHSQGSISYKIRGFIDKLFLYKDKSAIIRDFKTSKEKFKGKEVADNLQDYMYALAVKHSFPEYIKRASEFLFLKFDLDHDKDESHGKIEMNHIEDWDLEGFEHQLTEIQKYIDNFSIKDAKSNYAANQPYPSDNSFGGPLQCGFAKVKGQLKKDGSVMWHCPMRHPFDYYVVVDPDGKDVKSYTEKEFSENKCPAGYSYEKRSYNGCPRYYS